ncbi:MAG: hypothetical protein ACRC2Y_04330 [Aeromonas veronii]
MTNEIKAPTVYQLWIAKGRTNDPHELRTYRTGMSFREAESLIGIFQNYYLHKEKQKTGLYSALGI